MLPAPADYFISMFPLHHICQHPRGPYPTIDGINASDPGWVTGSIGGVLDCRALIEW